MMKTRLFIIFAILGVSQVICAQGVITFKSKKVDVGVLDESDSVVKLEFDFTNLGNSALKISSVKTSCGCMSAVWPKEDIAPNGSGTVLVNFQTYNRPGPFEKNFTVYSNGKPSAIKVDFEGMVKPKSKGVSFDYPVAKGDLRLENAHFNIGNITNEDIVTQSFKVFNQGDAPLKIIRKNAPSSIDINIEGGMIPANSSGQIFINYDPRLKTDFGFRRELISLVMSDTSQEKFFNVYSNVMEYFPDTIDMNQAPQILLNKGAHDFGTKKRNQSDSTTFIITNSGKKELIIREIEFDQQTLLCRVDNDTVPVGGSTKLHVKLLPSSTSGRKSSGVILFVNDPKSPRHSLKITARFER